MENDTLVELIQTAEYLEDAPSWEQRRFYPLQYGDPYFRGCGRGCGRGRGRGRGWLSEDVTERDTGGGRGRFYSCGNGRNDQDRKGFPPTSRRDIRLEMPPESEPSRFSDWSSLASLPARTSPHGALEVQAEQSNIAQNQNQLNVSTARIDNSAQTEQVRENQDLPARPIRSDLASNEENVTIIPPIPMRSAQSSLHAEDVVLPRIVPCESSINDDLSRSSSQRRSHDVNIEGISSICPVDSIRQSGIEDRGSGPTYQHEGIHLPRTSTVNRRDSSDSSDSEMF